MKPTLTTSLIKPYHTNSHREMYLRKRCHPTHPNSYRKYLKGEIRSRKEGLVSLLIFANNVLSCQRAPGFKLDMS